jgi:hypothetical protein
VRLFSVPFVFSWRPMHEFLAWCNDLSRRNAAHSRSARIACRGTACRAFRVATGRIYFMRAQMRTSGDLAARRSKMVRARTRT